MPPLSDRFVSAFRRRIVLPMVALMIVTSGLAGWLLCSIASEQDQRAAEQSVRAVRNALAARQETLVKTLNDYSAWGAAYEHLHTHFDFGWAYIKENVGGTLFKSYGFNYVFVVDPHDATIYSVVDGVVSHDTLDILVPGAAALVAKARAAGDNTTVVEAGKAESGGVLTLVGAAALSTGGDGSVAAVPGPASVLVFADRLTADKLDAMAADAGVGGLRAHAAEPSRHNGRTGLRLDLVDGGTRWLAWQPDQPGDTMLRSVMPWLVLALVVLASFVLLVFRHAARTAKLIADSASRLALAHEHAEHQARHDLATGLPNRLALIQYLDGALARPGARLVLIFADLDRFKPINDALGHAAGDHVLALVAGRLRQALRDGDIVARVGGDEFVIAVPDLDEREAEVLCRRLIAEVTQPMTYEGADIFVGLSMGVAMAPSDAAGTQELIRCADLALYQAKNDGRGTYRFFAEEMNERVQQRRTLEMDLRRGIGAGEFVLHYQPRYSTREMRLLSVEALVRWHHPERGVVSPAEFIPLAEETGLIVPLGEWILTTACSTLAAFEDVGVSVNVSPTQFRGGELPAMVRRVLAATSLEPHRLELELTESVLLEDTQKAQAALEELKGLGVRLTMDDFGTGYSSLGYLRNFPFDGIKIDQQFIADLDGTGDARAIVQAIVALGRALGMTVTAEGVETAEQLMLLRHDACEEVQGFYMSRPLTSEALARLIAAGGIANVPVPALTPAAEPARRAV